MTQINVFPQHTTSITQFAHRCRSFTRIQ